MSKKSVTIIARSEEVRLNLGTRPDASGKDVECDAVSLNLVPRADADGTAANLPIWANGVPNGVISLHNMTGDDAVGFFRPGRHYKVTIEEI